MGTIVDKLNYTDNAKQDIVKACLEKGVTIPPYAPLGTYGQYIREITTGGGDDGQNPFNYVFTDTIDISEEVASMPDMGLTMFMPKGGAPYYYVSVYIDDMKCTSLNATSQETSMGTGNQYVYGDYSVYIQDAVEPGTHTLKVIYEGYNGDYGMPNYSLFSAKFLYIGVAYLRNAMLKLLNTTDSMKQVNYSSDDGTTSYSFGTGLLAGYFRETALRYLHGIDINTVYISGNSYIGLGANAEHIKYNRRDNYVATYYVSYGQLAASASLARYAKIRWEGWAPYGNRSDPYRYAWEVLFFGSGNAMITRGPTGASATMSGTYSFLGVPYNAPTADNPYVSFYRKNFAGTKWEVDYKLITYDRFLTPISFVSNCVFAYSLNARMCHAPNSYDIGIVLTYAAADGLKFSASGGLSESEIVRTIDPVETSLTTTRRYIHILKATQVSKPNAFGAASSVGFKNSSDYGRIMWFNVSNDYAIKDVQVINANLESEEVSSVTVNTDADAPAIIFTTTYTSHNSDTIHTAIKSYAPESNDNVYIHGDAMFNCVIDESSDTTHTLSLAAKTLSSGSIASATKYKVWQTVVIQLEKVQ